MWPVEGEFSVLVEKSGAIFEADGAPDVVRSMLPLNLGAANLYRLFPKDQQEFAGEVLSLGASNTEGRITGITLVSLRGQRSQCHLTVQPAEPGRWWFHFVPAMTESIHPPSMIWVDYFDSVSYLVDHAPEKPIELMMLSFAALENSAVTGRLGKEGMEGLRAAIEAKLSSHAIDGNVGRLGNSSYAVVYDADDDMDDIVDDVTAATGAMGVGADELGLRTRTLALDKPGQGTESVQTALAHIRNSFLGDDDDDDFGGGAASLTGVLGQIELSKTRFLAALEAGDIALADYPVVALADGGTALHLVHGTLIVDGEPVAAGQRLILGDYPGLTLQHDLTMTREAVLEIAATRKAGQIPVPVIIDINAAALADDTFVPSVAQMLQVAAVTPAAIGFRALSLDLAKQSLPSFQNLLKLLQRGHSVWLTRFANAVTDSTLDGAFVEVTATYLQRLCDNPEGRDLVTQLLQVWRNAGVKLVAVDVQSPGQRAFVKDLGIGYAIGPAAAG